MVTKGVWVRPVISKAYCKEAQRLLDTFLTASGAHQQALQELGASGSDKKSVRVIQERQVAVRVARRAFLAHRERHKDCSLA
jgi:hypothetical protein